MDNYLFNELSKYKPFDEAEEDEKSTMLNFIKNNEDVLTRNNKIAHVTVSGWIFNEDKTKVLMIYHNIYNSWAWIGGHADGEDRLKEVLLKEIEEETGLKNVKFLSDDIYSIKIVTADNHIKRGKYVGSHLHLDIQYALEASEKEPTRIKEDENSGVKWIPVDKIKEYVSEERMVPVYEKLCKKITKI